MRSFFPGQRTPKQCVFWSMNDISGGTKCNVVGLSGTKKNNAEPQVLIALLGPLFETAARMIDEALKRSKTGAMQIFHIGGDHRRCQSESGAFKVNAMRDDIATLLRARMNQRVERYKAAGVQPKIMIMDGCRDSA